MDESYSRHRMSWFRPVAPWAACLAVVCAFHAQRLAKPTFLGDDVIRVVDARVMPLFEQLFRPFSEHIAPGFELATAAVVRPLGQRIDLLPAALTAFAFGSWVVMLAALAWWAKNITGRADAARLTLVFVGVSSACIEVPWWFSAATYSLAAACVFAVLALIAAPHSKPSTRFVSIAAVTALGMSFSAVGLMAVILGGLAALGRFRVKKTAFRDIAALGSGFLAYWIFARTFGGEIVSTETTRFSPMGFVYALAAPGGVAAPLFLGIDAHAVTARFSFALGIGSTLVLAFALWSWPTSRTLRLDLVAMALVPYLAIYPPRAALVESGAWARPDFLYFWTSRYHLFMTAALAVGAAMAVAKFRDVVTVRGFRLPAGFEFAVIVAFACCQYHNANLMRHFENQPDQAPTLAALMRLGKVAKSEAIPVEQLMRIVPAVRRGWNASVLELRPDRFHHVMLIAERFASGSNRQMQSSDADIAAKLTEKLGVEDWRILNANRLTNLDPAGELPFVSMRSAVPANMIFERAEQAGPNAWQIKEPFGHFEFTVTGIDASTFVIFENLSGEGVVHIRWTTDGPFDDFRTVQFDSKPSKHCPVPNRIVLRPSDFLASDGDRASKDVRVRIHTTQAGTLRIGRIICAASAVSHEAVSD